MNRYLDGGHVVIVVTFDTRPTVEDSLITLCQTVQR
jgi:hypothetical protein